MGRLDGKVCVITGAGGGMGADAAELFTQEGAQVVAADVNGDAAAKVADAVGGLGVQVDVSDEESVKAMYAAAAKQFGGIDVLYNNAGISPADDDSILDTSLEAWERVQAVNTRGVLPVLQARDPVPARTRRRLGDQRRVVRRHRRRGNVADLVHRVEGRGAVALEGARRAVRASGRARERALPRARSRRRSCSASGARLPARPSGASCTCRWGGWRSRARS